MKKRQLYKEYFYLPDEERMALKYKLGELSRFFGDSKGQSCRLCGKYVERDDFDIAIAYWKPFMFGCHKGCKKDCEKKEAYECQKIDSDCNDCFFFKRGKMIKKGEGSVWEGKCLKFNKKVYAFPNFCSSHKCFLHRLDGKK